MRVTDQGKEIVLDPSNYSYINLGKNERIASVVAGAAMTAYGAYLTRDNNINRNGNWVKLLVFPLGAYLFKRGLSGYCALNNLIGRNTAEQTELQPLELKTQIRVDKPRGEVYEQWKELQTLPEIFPHLKKVEIVDPVRSNWTLMVPNTFMRIHWAAEMTENQPGQKISWKSVEGSDIGNAGEVIFRDSEEGGTEVEVSIHYLPPAGALGKNVAGFLTKAMQKQLHRELEAFNRNLAAETPHSVHHSENES